MALELSKQAYGMCVSADASALQALLDLYLIQGEDAYDTVNVAAIHTSTECVQVLIDFKADVNNRSREQRSRYPPCCKYGRVDCMHLLLENNADVAFADQTGEIALVEAAC
jgi:ankyrin repeat protein